MTWVGYVFLTVFLISYLLIFVAVEYLESKCVSKASLKDLDKELSITLTCAYSSGTWRTRNSQWHRFLSFCSDNGLDPLPASVMTVCRFLMFCARTCKYSTVNNYLSAIISLHKYWGIEQCFRDCHLIKMLLNGLKSQLGTAVDKNKLFLLMNWFLCTAPWILLSSTRTYPLMKKEWQW